MSNKTINFNEILKIENQRIIFEVVNGVSMEDNLLIDAAKLKEFIFSKSQELLSTNKGNGIKNLIELNKEIIKESHNYILFQQAHLRNDFSVKKSELNNQYSVNLKKHQDDLNSYTKPPTENISFEDKQDEPIDNIKTLLSDTMLQRERELSMITGNYDDESAKKALGWLSVDSNYDDIQKPPKLNIGKIIESQNNFNEPVILNIKEKINYTNNNDNGKDNTDNTDNTDNKLKPILLNGGATLTKQDNDKINKLFSKLKPAKVSFDEETNKEPNKDKIIESLRKEIEELKETINELRKNN
tara:strand:- start:27 stop:926 length:900 start_codon:yes stop_codon:yes gene_type:complete